MSPRPRHLAATAAALALGLAAARAEAPAKPLKAVIELFTSQGCSSCPPADALVMELARDPGLIALTLPVTYWDYLGWKDTLGKDSFARRQKFYAKARGDGQVYTPQAVVNGTAHAIGSERADIEKAVSQFAATGFAASVTLKEEGGALRIRVAPAAGGAATSAGVWVLPTTHQAAVPVTRGENQGRTLSYANVVRGMVRVGDWTGGETTLTAPLSATEAPEADGYVVIVQAERTGKHGLTMPGAILGAARGPAGGPARR
ncbi:thioredoxin family protein [Bosea sp. (in: a-proteobacteria)]|uniref:DUF1223 domain-containing protein n=1 Tax=Bosea sp. (in: a-proteobacteria) TaxID=1871050 RepID=UPI00261E8C79|nr:DUF1223 domain-containing protein [Bosea sp. (in: a-proteobacteria)]MCO5090554.1 DUF1223 domain-containing protein [Bosea sp. (in: a-proteobacteria)]